MFSEILRTLSRLLLAAGVMVSASAGAQTSSLVFPGTQGGLIQRPDALGDRVPEFSQVGYRNGNEPLPDVQFLVESNRWVFVAPTNGPADTLIQSAINTVSNFTVNANGFRGVVQLAPGAYTITNTLFIRSSGIVLRGAGDGTDTNFNTILRSTSTSQISLIEAGLASGSLSRGTNVERNLIDFYLPVGATSFRVDATNGWRPGDRIVVDRPSTTNWITDLGMDRIPQNSDTSVVQWAAGAYDQRYERVITRLEGNRVFINAPLPNSFEQRYGGGTAYRYNFTRLNNIGIEHLRGESLFISANNETHAWSFIELERAEDCWVRDITARYFGFAAVLLSTSTLRVTAEDLVNLDPQSVVTGGRRYAFNNQGQLNLMRYMFSEDGRHDFVNNSPSRGPNVFYDGIATNQFSESGPHQRWSTGTVYDNLVVDGEALAAYNRGNFGTGHGWSGANMVFWNSRADILRVENPFTAQNWVIGCIGTIQNPGDFLNAPIGTYDSHGTNVSLGNPIHNPDDSLYVGQWNDRLANPSEQLREYLLGDHDQFVSPDTNGVDAVPVDAAWLTAITPLLGGAATVGFDTPSNDVFVPFTFDYQLAPGERVVRATLTLAMRRPGGASTNDSLWLESPTNAISFPALGLTNNISSSTNTPAILIYQIPAPFLTNLNDGRLNALVGDDVSVDWATLSLRVATVPSAVITTLAPAADAFIQDGTSATNNQGSSASLNVKAAGDANFRREALLRFDLASVTGAVANARLRLYCTSVSDPVRHELAFVGDDSWSEATVTWTNAPETGGGWIRWAPAASNWVELPVTHFVRQALTNDDQLSFRIRSLSITSNGFVNYASSEAAASNQPQLIITVSNTPPTLATLTNRTVAEDTSTGPIALTVGDLETDPSLLTLAVVTANPALVPTNQVTFGGAGASRTVSILPATNQFGTSLVTIAVSDPQGLVTNRSFTLTVTNVNDAPVLATVSNRVLGAGQLLTLTNTATDVETNALTFALLTSPTGMTLGASSGILSWRPAVAQADSNHLVRLRVTDNGLPNLSATQQFNVLVNPLATPLVAPAAISSNRIQLTIVGDAGPDYTVQASTNLSAWTNLFTTNSPALPLLWVDTNANSFLKRFYRVLLGP